MRPVQPRLIACLLYVGVPATFGLLALLLGMDADWDLRNYHYYNAWALLTDRYQRDIAVAQIPTFYNPLLDVPYFLLAQVLSARGVAFVLGALHGLNFIVLACLAERLLTVANHWKRLGIAATVAGSGVCGAVALSEVGTVFYDNLLSLGLFCALLLGVHFWTSLIEQAWQRALPRAFAVGLPVGLAFGLKQTSVIYAVGLCLALLATLPATPGRRIVVTFCCGLGVLAGLAAGGGYWMWHLWHLYGNPLFPMFNQVFRSPWGLIDSYRDTQYLEGSSLRHLFYPLVFSFDSRQASEIVFRDFRILAGFCLLPMVGLARLLRPRDDFGRGLLHPGPAAFVLVTAAASYVVWLQLFALYRYITALEMLAPLLIVLSVGSFSRLDRARLPLAICLIGLLVVSTRPGTWIRVPFSEKAVEATVPPINDPATTIVLLAGHEPLSFLLPSFPAELRFLRIDSTFTNPDQTTVRFNDVMRSRIARHQGTILALFIPTERHDVITRLGDYGLQLSSAPCAAVTSPIGAAAYDLCPVERLAQ